MLVLPQSAHAGLSEGCFPIVQCNSGEDFYGNACQPHVETLTGAVDSCESINGAPAAGKSWAFSCDAGCYQKGGGGGSVNPCPGGVMVGGQCLITLDVVDDDVPVTGTTGYKIWDGTDLTHVVHVATAGCGADGEVAVRDAASPSGWSCAAQTGLWSTNGTDVWRATGKVGIGNAGPTAAALEVDNTGTIGVANGLNVSTLVGGGVGIVTTGPSAGLVSNGDIHVMGDDAVRVIGDNIESGTSRVGVFEADNSGNFIHAGSESNHDFSIVTNDTRRITADTSGRVGIGTTTPVTDLTVQGTTGLRVTTGQHPNVFGDIYHAYSGGMIVNSQTGGSWADLSFQTNGTTKMFLESAGNLGIGTVAPASRLHVVGPSNLNASFGGSGIGVVATADGGGALLSDANSNAITAIANDNIGISALGDTYGGYFGDSNSSGYASVGHGDAGINAHGNSWGGFFNDLNSSDDDTWVSSNGYSIIANGPINVAETSSPAYYVNNSEALRLTGSRFDWGSGGSSNYFPDRVVIGTTSPVSSHDLEVAGSTTIWGQGYFNGNVYVNNSTWPGNGYLRVKGGSGYDANLELYEEVGSTLYGWQLRNDGSSDRLYLITEWPGNPSIDGQVRMTWEYGGDTGIGTTNPSYKLHVYESGCGGGCVVSRFQGTNVVDIYGDGWVVAYGNARKPGGGSWLATSDQRVKDVRGNFEKGLDEILGLNPVHYNYKDGNEAGYDSDVAHIGLVAQEVEPLFPESISEDHEGYLQLDTQPIDMAMINAIKELKSENDALKGVVCELKPEADICG